MERIETVRKTGHRPLDHRTVRHHLLFAFRQHDIRGLPLVGHSHVGFLQGSERRLHTVAVPRPGDGRQSLRGHRVRPKGQSHRVNLLHT